MVGSVVRFSRWCGEKRGLGRGSIKVLAWARIRAIYQALKRRIRRRDFLGGGTTSIWNMPSPGCSMWTEVTRGLSGMGI